MRMCSLETSVMLPSVTGASQALLLANSSCRMEGGENTKLLSGTSCSIRNEIIPSKVQWKAELLWQADNVFSLLFSLLWEERALIPFWASCWWEDVWLSWKKLLIIAQALFSLVSECHFLLRNPAAIGLKLPFRGLPCSVKNVNGVRRCRRGM